MRALQASRRLRASIYRRAAHRLWNDRNKDFALPATVKYACHAIILDEGLGNYNRFIEDFECLFKPENQYSHQAWLMISTENMSYPEAKATDLNMRLTALCLMAAIVEAGDEV